MAYYGQFSEIKMTHISTAVLELTPSSKQKTVLVATNRATELRMKKLAEQKNAAVETNRAKPAVKEGIRNKMAIFENSSSEKEPTKLPRLSSNGSINMNLSKKNNELAQEKPIIIESTTTRTRPIPNVSVDKKVKKIETNSEIPLIIQSNKITRKETQTVIIPIKPPSINLDIRPWQSSGTIIITDSNQVEVEKVFEARNKRINNEISIEKDNEKPKEHLDVSSGENSVRNSTDDELLLANFPRAIDLARHNRKPLWKDIPGVVNSGKFDSLDKDARTRQEAKFEVMLSEGSFLNSLNTLKKHYMENIRKHIPQVLTEKDYDMLFKHVEDLRVCSEKLLNGLDEEWQTNLMLDGIYRVITAHLTDNYQPYIRYCRDMLDMSNHLNELNTSNESFKSLLDVLINREGSQRLTLDAFLTSPMQRITKLPLLLKTILDKSDESTEEYKLCKTALDAASKVALECDRVVNEKKNFEQLVALNKELEFPPETRTLPIVIKNRHLVSRANVKHFAFRDKAPKKEKLQLILFNDLLLVTKRKGDKQYSIVDYCDRDKVQVKEMENPILLGDAENSKKRNPIVLTMWSIQEKKLDLIVTFKDSNQGKEWLQTLATENSNDDDNVVQVIALQEHYSDASDELQLSPGDVIKVTGPEIDGWSEGELLSDGTKGRFPTDKVTKITSPKVKAANMKTRKELRSSQNLEDIPLS